MKKLVKKSLKNRRVKSVKAYGVAGCSAMCASQCTTSSYLGASANNYIVN